LAWPNPRTAKQSVRISIPVNSLLIATSCVVENPATLQLYSDE
jgi:hypothetical protein